MRCGRIGAGLLCWALHGACSSHTSDRTLTETERPRPWPRVPIVPMEVSPVEVGALPASEHDGGIITAMSAMALVGGLADLVLKGCAAGSAPCQMCVVRRCCKPITRCEGQAGCPTLLFCFDHCDNVSCIEQCRQMHEGFTAEALDLLACMTSVCHDDCSIIWQQDGGDP
jgi:hypothetical protein